MADNGTSNMIYGRKYIDGIYRQTVTCQLDDDAMPQNEANNRDSGLCSFIHSNMEYMHVLARICIYLLKRQLLNFDCSNGEGGGGLSCPALRAGAPYGGALRGQGQG